MSSEGTIVPGELIFLKRHPNSILTSSKNHQILVTGGVSQYATVPLECELSSVTVDSDVNAITDQDITAINEAFSDLRNIFFKYFFKNFSENFKGDAFVKYKKSSKVKLTVSVSDSTDNPLVHAAVGAAGITYTEAATAEIGNHIQLRKFLLAYFPWYRLDVLRIGK